MVSRRAKHERILLSRISHRATEASSARTLSKDEHRRLSNMHLRIARKYDKNHDVVRADRHYKLSREHLESFLALR